MEIKDLVREWFKKWETGDFHHLPLSDNFTHTSPFGSIVGKQEYLSLVETNRDKFLGYRFEIQDSIFDKDKACVRYTTVQNDFKLDVSEWYYFKDNLIDKIFAYYHIGEIRDDRQLKTS